MKTSAATETDIDEQRVLAVPGFVAYRLWVDGLLESNWRNGPHYPGMPSPDRWRALPLKAKPNGYIPVNLRGANGVNRRTHIHRLLAEMFIGPAPFSGAVVRHRDGNSRNNTLTNLVWGSYAENEQDKHRHGTWRPANAKLTALARDSAFILRSEGKTHAVIANALGVSRPSISRLLSGGTWS